MSSAASSTASPRRGPTRWMDNLFHGFTLLVALGVLALVAAFVIVLLEASRASLDKFGLAFLVTSTWDPARSVFGAVPFIDGTLLTSAIGLLIAVPLSLGIAIFLSELAPNWIAVP